MQRKPLHITALCLGFLAFGTATQAAEQIVKIGMTGPLSGGNAYAGRDNQNGVTLAIQDLNAKKIMVAGQTIKFELHSEDDQCDPRAGVMVAQKLIDSGIKYVFGPYCSGVAIPASRVYSEGGAMLSTVGSNPKVTQGGYKNLFRIIAGDNQIGSSMATYAARALKAKTVGVIDDRTAFGQGLAEEFIKEAKTLGLTVVAQEFTTDKASDFSAILTSLKNKQPDVIFFGGYTPQGGPLLRQMKQLGITAKLLGGDTVCTPELGKFVAGAADDTLFCAQGGAILNKTVDGPKFRAIYQKRFNQEPDAYAASFYDQTMLMAESMQKANSLDVDKVGAEMYKASYKGIAGVYAYDEKGNMKKAPVTVYVFKNGVPVPLESY